MLEQLLVELSYPFTANCHKCTSILFEIRIIDQFVRTPRKNIKQQQKDGANLYMLHPQIIPSTITIEKANHLNQTQPFNLLFVNEVKCSTCRECIGCKLLSVSSDIPNYQLLGRVFIDAKKVRIKTHREDVTDQLMGRFEEDWDNQTDLDSIDLSEQKKIYTQDNMGKKQNISKSNTNENNEDDHKRNTKVAQKQTANNRKSQGILKNNVKKQGNQNNELKYLRKQLQTQTIENKQLIRQIVSSIDFFNQILQSLQKRVSKTEMVCDMLKSRVQSAIPMIRKKSQQ